eukprot:671053-Hanusia_phi.AAC.2
MIRSDGILTHPRPGGFKRARPESALHAAGSEAAAHCQRRPGRRSGGGAAAAQRPPGSAAAEGGSTPYSPRRRPGAGGARRRRCDRDPAVGPEGKAQLLELPSSA